MTYNLVCPAKINLSLKIFGKDPISGYHFLESFIKKINFNDEISIKFSPEIQFFKINFIYGEWVEKNQNTFEFEILDPENNLITKTIRFFEKYSGILVKNLEILCKKNIPYGSGLGGGSSNSAEILKFLQKYYNHYLDFITLKKIPLELGSDVSLFLKDFQDNKICLLKGLGGDIEIIETNVIFNNLKVLIFFPYKKFDTRSMFKKFSEKGQFDRGLKEKSFEFSYCYNSFYSILSDNEKESIDSFLETIKSSSNYVFGGLSGSGSACFGIFKDFDSLKMIKENIEEKTNAFVEIFDFI